VQILRSMCTYCTYRAKRRAQRGARGTDTQTAAARRILLRRFAAEFVASQDAASRVTSLDHPVPLSARRERSLAVGPPVRAADREVDGGDHAALVKPDMADGVARAPSSDPRPKGDARADGERVRRSDELSIDDVSPHPGAFH